MHHNGTSEVSEAPFSQRSTAPLPHSADWIDQSRQNDTVEQVACEFHSTGDSTRNDRCGCGSESHLEQKVGSVTVVTQLCNVLNAITLAPDTAPCKPLAGTCVAWIHQSVSDKHEQHDPDRQVHDVLKDNVDRVFGSVKADFDHRKARLHEQDQNRTNEHDQCVDHIVGLCFLVIFRCDHFGHFSGRLCSRCRFVCKSSNTSTKHKCHHQWHQPAKSSLTRQHFHFACPPGFNSLRITINKRSRHTHRKLVDRP